MFESTFKKLEDVVVDPSTKKPKRVLYDPLTGEVAVVDSRKKYEDYCKAAVQFFRGHVLDEKLFIAYVSRTPEGRIVLRQNAKAYGQPCGVAIAFMHPEMRNGDTQNPLCVGASFCYPRDRWNRHIGLWRAIRAHSWVKSDIVTSMVDAELPKAVFKNLLSRELDTNLLDPPWDILVAQHRCCPHPIPAMYNGKVCPTCDKPLWRYTFPPSTRRAVLLTIRSAGKYMNNKEKAADEKAASSEPSGDTG